MTTLSKKSTQTQKRNWWEPAWRKWSLSDPTAIAGWRNWNRAVCWGPTQWKHANSTVRDIFHSHGSCYILKSTQNWSACGPVSWASLAWDAKVNAESRRKLSCKESHISDKRDFFPFEMSFCFRKNVVMGALSGELVPLLLVTSQLLTRKQEERQGTETAWEKETSGKPKNKEHTKTQKLLSGCFSHSTAVCCTTDPAKGTVKHFIEKPFHLNPRNKSELKKNILL